MERETEALIRGVPNYSEITVIAPACLPFLPVGAVSAAVVFPIAVLQDPHAMGLGICYLNREAASSLKRGCGFF